MINYITDVIVEMMRSEKSVQRQNLNIFSFIFTFIFKSLGELKEE